MRLIDADACIDYIRNNNQHAWETLAYAPTIDAVEVVRCKDCKHSHMTYDGSCKYCDMWDEDGEALYLEGDFFCAYGERREDSEA